MADATTNASGGGGLNHLPRRHSDVVRHGVSAAAGSAEVRLVDSTCAPGGLRVPLTTQQCKQFFAAATNLDGFTIAAALITLVCAPPQGTQNAWHAQVRALCIIEEAFNADASKLVGDIVAGVRAEAEVVTELANEPNAHEKARQKAVEVAKKIAETSSAGGAPLIPSAVELTTNVPLEAAPSSGLSAVDQLMLL